MSDRIDTLVAAVAGSEAADSFGQTVVRVAADSVVALVEAAHAAGFTMFTDLCAVDHHTREPRFDAVITLTALDPPERIRIITGVPGDDPTLPSITAVFPGADFYEREAFDLFGLHFAGHPDLTRILLPDDWSGYPLRKDFPVGSVPVQFKGSNQAT